jgi:hypothetical protein
LRRRISSAVSSASAGAADAEKTTSDNAKSDASLAQVFVFIACPPSRNLGHAAAKNLSSLSGAKPEARSF